MEKSSLNHNAIATEQSEIPSLEILQSEWSMHSHAFIISLDGDNCMAQMKSRFLLV